MIKGNLGSTSPGYGNSTMQILEKPTASPEKELGKGVSSVRALVKGNLGSTSPGIW